MTDKSGMSSSPRYPEEVRTDKTVEINNRGSVRKRHTELKNRSSRVGIEGLHGTKAEKQEKKRPMLTSSQLSDLFTRLDKDGDGELDLNEFTGIIKMLKIKVSPDYIARVFRSVDETGNSSEVAGTLDLQEFIAAYQKIYTGVAVDGMDAASSQRKSFVRATRYGYTADKNYIFECYTIPSEGIPQVFTLTDLPNEDDPVDNSIPTLDPLTVLGLTKGEPWTVDGEAGTVDHIYKMMRQDSMKNKAHNASLMWWVDVSYSMVDWTTAEELVSKFGLPNDSKFLASFGNFGNGLPADPKSRMFAGTGNHMIGNVHSLSHFAQSLYIEQVPVVHHLPPWLKAWQCTAACTSPTMSKVLDGLVKYYTTRFAWMANLSSLSKTAADEKISAYERAEGLATLLKSSGSVPYGDDDEYSSDEEEDFSTFLDPAEFSQSTLFTSRGRGAPLPPRAGYSSPPTWLRSNSQIFAKPPRVRVDSISLHVLDQGFGPNGLLTVRQMDPEKQQKRFLSHSQNYSPEQLSRMGIIGRIISGVWIKVAEVTMRGRGTEVAGELTESPATLVTFLLMLIHNFSMNSCASMDYWLKTLEKEIKDIVVSKHSLHLSEVERILKDFSSYLDPLESLMQTMAQQQEEYSQDILSNRITEMSPRHRASSMDATPVSTMRRRSIAVAMETKLFEALPPEAEKMPLSFAILHAFFGADPYREIRAVLDGYRQLDIKGLVYWRERLKKYSTKIDSLKELIALQLDDKRNFMSFMLTVITTLLAPLAILTGYFGMNFENMSELHPDTWYPSAPGVKLMWVIAVASYVILFLFAVHSRVLYSAT